MRSVVRGAYSLRDAVPPRPHANSAIDELATARLRLDENLMAMSSHGMGSTRNPKISRCDANVGHLSNQAFHFCLINKSRQRRPCLLAYDGSRSRCR
jgi:hypothetical protein